MHSLYTIVLVTVAFAGCTIAAPRPISLEEVGRKLRELGQKSMPAVRSVCGLVNSYQPYPGGQGFPQVQGYYPQYPTFYPQYPQYNPNYGSALPKIPPSNDGSPRVDTSEQDDLNGVDTAEVVRNERNIPPEIQDVLKNFNKLPEFHGTAK